MGTDPENQKFYNEGYQDALIDMQEKLDILFSYIRGLKEIKE